MNNYNPVGFRICRDGVTRDKYGRPFEFNEKEFKRKRKTHAHPGYAAMTHEEDRRRV